MQAHVPRFSHLFLSSTALYYKHSSAAGSTATNATSVAEVLGEKEASRDRVLQELKKISSLADKFTAMDLGDITRASLTSTEAQLTRFRRDFSCRV